MNKILFFFLIMSAYVFSQSWNTTITTSINEPNVVKMDLFTNKEGNHIVVQNSNASNSIKYYLVNSSGTLIRSATIETSGSAEFPCISGDNDKIYVIYKLGSNLETRKSTNAGQSWINTILDVNVGNNTCNGIDAVYDNRGLHVVYAMQENGSNYETYYRKINSSDNWVDFKNVTDYGSEVGGFPSVAVSNNRIHISYNTGNNSDPNNNYGISKTRDKNGTNWETPQTVIDTQNESSAREKVQVRTTKLYDFYYEFWCDGGHCDFELKVRSRELTSTTWSSYTSIYLYTNPKQFMGAEQTANSNLHIIYGDWDLMHKYYNGSNWSSETYLSTLNDGDINAPLSSVSNDLFLFWKDYNSNYLKYAQWDDAPLSPQNLTVEPFENAAGGINPKLNWSLNNEPDVYINTTNAYEIQRRTRQVPGSFGSWSTIGYRTGAVDYFIDGEIEIAGTGVIYQAEYRLRARDISGNISPFSTTVSILFGEYNKIMVREKKNNIDYTLAQNFPNPFNPTTQIEYSIKSPGTVTLKVYNMLGQEVADLVNERKEPGNYSVTFNASDLPSGIYVYKLTANNFTDTKKLMLVK